MAYSQYDLQIAKLLKCMDVGGNNVMRDVSRAMYKSKGKETGNGTMPLKTYMKNAKISINFTDEVESLLGCNIMVKNYDISFANKLIQDICKDVFDNLSEHCQKHVKLLVDFRNEMSHFYISENTDISKKHDFLKEVIKEIYRGVAKSLNKGVPKASRMSFDSVIKNVCESLDHIQHTPITVNDVSLHFEELKGSVIFKVLEIGMRDICRHQDKLRVLNPCTWAYDDDEAQRFNLDKIFTDPELRSDSGDITVKNILIARKVRGNEVELPAAIILQGEHGSGKTTFCYYLIHAWRNHPHLIEGLKKFKLVLFVEIGRTTSRTMLQYLRDELMKETFSNLRDDDILEVLSQLDVLVIIDGYDESDRKSPLVKDILEKFGKKRIIITTRTTLKEELKLAMKRNKVNYLLVDLKGFDESNQIAYVEKVFAAAKRNGKEFKRYLKGRGKVLNKHLKLPLTLAYLIVLWMDDPTNVNYVTTATSLYKELFNYFKKRLKVRLTNQHKYHGNKDLPKLLDEFMLLLGKHAWELLLEGRDTDLPDTNKKCIEKVCRKEKLDTTELLSAFLKCEINEDGDSRDREYSFLHKTQTEYLASYYLSHSIKEGEKLDAKTKAIEDWKRYDQLLVYLTGNMALKGNLKGREGQIVEIINKIEIMPSDYSYLWYIVSESRIDFQFPESPEDPITYTKLVHEELGVLIAKKLQLYVNWYPDFQNTAAALRLMSLIPVKVERLEIKIPENEEPFEIPDFIEAIEEVGNHVGKGRRICTELLLMKHETYECDNTSDRFLKGMESWANLEKFTGSLGSVYNLKGCFPTLNNIRCKVTTPEVLQSFIKFRGSVRILRLSLQFLPSHCNPKDIMDLQYKGPLELSFQDITEEQLIWMCDITKRLSNKYGLKSLSLKHSELSYDRVKKLIGSLNGFLEDVLEIPVPSEGNIDEEEKLQSLAKFRIEWL